MTRPLRIHVPGRPYHIVGRGNNKACLFHNERDYRKFLEYLAESLDCFAIECLSYCLLWNHYHLLVIPYEFTVSQLMQRLNTAYCVWFNRKHGRVGHVLQGRFGARIVDDAEYLLRVIRYIAINPVAASLVKDPAEWRWSSYRATAGLCAAPPYLALDPIWKAFNCTTAETGREAFVPYVAARAAAEDKLQEALLFGGDLLTRQVKPLLQPHEGTDAYTYAHRFAARPPLDALFLNADSRAAVIDAARNAFRRHAYTLRQIGDFVGRTESTISKWIHKADAAPGEAKVVGRRRVHVTTDVVDDADWHQKIGGDRFKV